MDPRIETSLAHALQTRDTRDFLERAAPAIGLPGNKPKAEVARVLGMAIAKDRARGRELAKVLGEMDREDAKVIAAATFAAFALNGQGRNESLAALQEIANDPRSAVRHGVIDAVRTLLEADLAATLVDLAEWTDGFLQAHIALEALSDRKILVNVVRPESLLELLEAAWHLADDAPRSADRWQGVRVLRQGLPAQITAFVTRFNDLFAWVMDRASATRPETREIIEHTILSLEKATFRRADVDTLRAAFAKSAKAPRDPSRIVHGTRKRSRR